MKIVAWMRTIPCCGLLLVCLGWLPRVSADVIIAGADEWCPMNCTAGSTDPGFMVEVAQTIFRRAGHTFEYQNMPWARALSETRKGAIQAAIGAFRGDAPDFVFPEQSQARLSSNSLFTLKTVNWKYAGLNSLRNRTLGAILSYDYGEQLNQYIRQHSYSGRIEMIAGLQPLRRNIEKARMGRIDVIIENGPVFWYTANQMGVAGLFQEVGQVDEAEDCFIAFSPALPNSEKYARILSEGMAEMRASGELAKALEKYGLKDWQ